MERNEWDSGCSKRSTERGELMKKEGWKIVFTNLLRQQSYVPCDYHKINLEIISFYEIRGSQCHVLNTQAFRVVPVSRWANTSRSFEGRNAFTFRVKPSFTAWPRKLSHYSHSKVWEVRSQPGLSSQKSCILVALCWLSHSPVGQDTSRWPSTDDNEVVMVSIVQLWGWAKVRLVLYTYVRIDQTHKSVQRCYALTCVHLEM